ncbi:MAG: SH3 domain-containing protein [Christensenellaceae bacterium]|nr:SH3 domain-containing protein [Christensenellaceae bacterium]
MKRLMAFCLALMLLVCAVPMRQADAASMTATVKGGWLHLRQSPSTSSAIISSYYTGTKVTILGSSGSWYHVKVGSKTGYMMASYLNVNADSGSTSAPSGNLNITAWVTSANGGNVRMRSGPSTNYSVLASYKVGTQVTILAKGTYWFQISVNGKVGYMMSSYLTTTAPGSSSGSSDLPSGGSGYIAYVWAANGGTVNLRLGAGKNFSVIGSYSVGTPVTVLTYGTTWCSVRVGTRTGYMMTEFLRTDNASSGGATTSPSGGYVAYVTSTNGKGVNLRSGAGKSYRVIAVLPVGTQLTVLQHNAKWDMVRFGTTDGYMDNSFLTTIAPDGSASDTPSGSYTATVYCATNSFPVRMRKGAGTGFAVIASVPQGAKVTVMSVSNGWAYITYNGTTGYMMASFLLRNTTDVTAVAVNTYTAKPGDTLTATTTPAGATVTYSWVDSQGNVLAATSTYTVRTDDVGKQIAVRVVGTGDYSGNVISPYVTIVEAAKTELTGVTISNGISPVVGQVLTASVTPAGATATYRWFRGDGTQVGTSSSYEVSEKDLGYVLYCVATGLGDYSGEVKSEATGVVRAEATKTDLK